jgi:hypothetical protein
MGYIGSEAELDTELRHAPERVWAAVIASGAVDFSDWVDVVIPNLDGNGGDLRWQDVRWQPRDGNLLPKRGDECVVILDDNNELWVPVWWPANPVLNYGTTLPSSPYNGQEYTLVDSTTNPSYQWRFRYNANSTSTYKWEFVGGVPFSTTVATNQSTSSTSPVDLATVGPSFTLPRAGDYIFTWGAECGHSAAGNAMYVSMMIAGSGNPTTNVVSVQSGVAYLQRASRVFRGNGVAAGSVKLQYSISGTGTGAFQARDLQILPVRV